MGQSYPSFKNPPQNGFCLKKGFGVCAHVAHHAKCGLDHTFKSPVTHGFQNPKTLLKTIVCLQSKILQNYTGCQFKIDGFRSGEAISVANTLRRTLLHDITGVAIVSASFKGLNHDYEPLPGVQETCREVLSNLRSLVFASDFERFPPAVGLFRCRGPGRVLAKHLALPLFLHTVHPDTLVANLNENADFECNVLICCGRGGVKPEFDQNKSGYENHAEDFAYALNPPRPKEKTSQTQVLNHDVLPNLNHGFMLPGWQTLKQASTKHGGQKRGQPHLKTQNPRSNENTPLKPASSNPLCRPKKTRLTSLAVSDLESRHVFVVNSMFNPVVRVNYSLQNRFENGLEHETIFFEIWCNGSLSPRQALHEAACNNCALFLPFQNVTEISTRV